MSLGDGILFGLCAFAALVTIAVIGVAGYEIISGAVPAVSKLGLGFLTHSLWAPNFNKFGAGALIFGTLVSSAMALLLAVPDRRGDRPVSQHDGRNSDPSDHRPAGRAAGRDPERDPRLLGDPRVVAVRSRALRAVAQPRIRGFIPLFGSPQTVGSSLFAAGLILTIMVVPIVASLSRDLFLTVPREMQDGAAALGATRWEVIRGVVLPTTAPGVIAASVLGLGRALGEAIAVTQVIGAGTAIHGSLFRTGGHPREPDRRAVPGREPALALVTLLSGADPARDRPDHQPDSRSTSAGASQVGGMVGRMSEQLFDPTAPLTPSGNLRRRELVGRLGVGACTAAAVLAVAILGVVIFTVAKRGASSLSLDFLIKAPPIFGGPGGGIAPELVGTIILVALATAIATPIGILTALYLTEFAGGRFARVVQSAIDLMQGLPSIIVGVLVFGLLVAGHRSRAMRLRSRSPSSCCR